MTIKQQINQGGSFKKCITDIIAFFIPFTGVASYQFYSITSPTLFTKKKKLRLKKQLRYTKRGRK